MKGSRVQISVSAQKQAITNRLSLVFCLYGGRARDPRSPPPYQREVWRVRLSKKDDPRKGHPRFVIGIRCRLRNQQVDTGTGQVAQQNRQGEAFQVVTERNLLHAHHRNAGCRADNQEAASRNGAVGQEGPE